METEVRPFDYISPRTTLESLAGAEPHIPVAFRQRIMLHLVVSFLSEELARFGMTAAPILGIQGAPGAGKSWQTRMVAAQMGIGLVRLSAAHLSSRWEGEPARILVDSYRFAASQQGTRAALLIDDLDTGVAAIRENMTYTVNSQLLAGALMNLCDDPEHVAGAILPRCPILITGNNLSVLYGPLTRFGRMELFTWEPSLADRIQILRRIFPEAELGEDQATTLGELRYGTASDRRRVPVSFFPMLRAHVLRRRLLDLLPSTPCHVSEIEDAVVEGLETSPPLAAFGEILQAAQELAESHHMDDFLEAA